MYLKNYNNLEAHLSLQNPAKALLKFYLWLSLYDTLNNFLRSKSFTAVPTNLYSGKKYAQ